jgi:hypothetical protein
MVTNTHDVIVEVILIYMKVGTLVDARGVQVKISPVKTELLERVCVCVCVNCAFGEVDFRFHRCRVYKTTREKLRMTSAGE